MARAVRVGVIGTGFGAGVVAPAFAAVEDCEVVEVVTPRDDAAAAALCARADLDLVSVHSPPFLHLDHVRRAIEAGHAVHCDKPFGRNARESAEMVDLAQESGVVNLLNFERRFDPTRQRLRALLQEGAIGEPDHFQYSRFIAVPQPRAYGWLSSKELGGGWLGGQGSHLIDACRWLFGEVTEAVAVMRTLVPERPDANGVLHKCDAEDGFVASLRTETGVTAVIDCALESSVSTPEQTRVFGATGTLEIGDAGIVRRTADDEVETFEVDMEGKTNLVVSMERWASVVCDAVRNGVAGPGLPTFADGLACAVVMDRMGR
ncbi:MAG: Gfo/Idh/MocA family protein [Acidimicrobiales bacterium]